MNLEQILNGLKQVVDFVKEQNLSQNETILFCVFTICLFSAVTVFGLYVFRYFMRLILAPFRQIVVRARERYSDEVLERLAEFEDDFSKGVRSVLQHECNSIISAEASKLATESSSSTRMAIDTGIAAVISQYIQGKDFSDSNLPSLIQRIESRLQTLLASSDTVLDREIDKGILTWVQRVFDNGCGDSEDELNQAIEAAIVKRVPVIASEDGSSVQLKIDSGLTNWAADMFTEHTDHIEDDLNVTFSGIIVARASELIATEGTGVQKKIDVGLTSWAADMFTEYTDSFSDDLNTSLGKQIVARADVLTADSQSDIFPPIDSQIIEWLRDNGEEIIGEHSDELSEAVGSALPGVVTTALGDPTTGLSDAVVRCVREKLER